MTTAVALVRGRLRPVPWGWLATLLVGWSVLTQLLATAVGDPQVGVVIYRWAASLVGLGVVVLTAPESDPPRDVLRATSLPLWRTLALRLAGWLALGAAPSRLVGARRGASRGPGDGAWRHRRVDDHRPGLGGTTNFLLVTAAGFLAARVTSTLGGGAAALTTVIALDLVARAWPAEFPIQLLSVPGDPSWQASRAWIVVGSLGLVAVALVLERSMGTRLGLPRRRPSTRPHPAAQARSRP
jgi:hypothetical protein